VISIIIPTYTNAAGLRACLESIAAQTPQGTEYEVIVVANGAPADTQRWCWEFAHHIPLKILWHTEALGMTRACNVGAREAKGEYLVLLNDDTVILGPQWLDLLRAPLDADPQMAITGPQKEHDPNSHHDFLIFFCVMIRRTVWDQLGGMDEVFNPGFGEDTDTCIRAERAGYHWCQVPQEGGHFLADKPNDSTLPEWKQQKMWVGDYPIYHDGEQTFGKTTETNALLERNREILRLRYDETVDITQANGIGGWFGPSELRWLALHAPEHRIILEVGSWHGRSSRAIADHLAPGAVLYCVDTWNGSSGEPGFHATAKLREGDDAFLHFNRNMADHIAAGRVRPVRMTSANAAALFRDLGIRPDMIFIDGDHSRPGITADLEDWTPLLEPGGLLCGHDFFPLHEGWMEVYEVVTEHFPGVHAGPDTSIWIAPSSARPRVVYDCFPFFNELDILELRFAELDPVVDRWVITEGTLTYQGQPKELLFEKHKDRFAQYLHKITHIVVNDFPETTDPWVRERWQRDAAMRALTGCWPEDIILIGDADEIPRAAAVAAYQPTQGLCRLKQRLFYGYANLEDPRGWDWQKIAPYRIVRERRPCGVRYPPAGEVPLLADAGWHFSFMGGPAQWVTKLEATAHQEYRAEAQHPDELQRRVARGEDMLGRPDCRYAVVPVDERYPVYLREHEARFADAGFFLQATRPLMHPEAHQFVAQVRARFPAWFRGKRVLEVGSLNINGTVREFFTDCEYVGIDLAPGPGVDRVIRAHDLIELDAYDVVISTEALEHDRYWERSLVQMVANLKPGGLFVLTCAGPNRAEHGTARTDTFSSPFTMDYYRNLSAADLRRFLPLTMIEIEETRGGEDVCCVGFKERTPPRRPTTRLTVTACVSTKDRYTTTLPMALMALAQQTVAPDRIEVYDDGEQKDLRELPPFNAILALWTMRGIAWEMFTTPRGGQVLNHQHCLDTATTDLIWRVDDDEVPEPTCLERLLDEMQEGVGAVGGLVLIPGATNSAPDWLTGRLEQIDQGPNLQWCQWDGGPRDVEHLYSTFLYRVEAGRRNGYPANLSRIGHREETLFTHQMFREAWRLVVTPKAITWHLQQMTGGIRSTDARKEMWEGDERKFAEVLGIWGVERRPAKVVVLDCGIGDHLAFQTAYPKIKAAHPERDYILAVCYPELFPGERLLSIADAKQMLGDKFDITNFYRWMWDHQWTRTLPEAWEAMYR
jgi:GT2 family glycosyltransferase/SAM-dependent methyltransferase